MSPPIVHTKDIPAEGLVLAIPLDAAWLRTALHDTGIEPVGDPAGKARVRLNLVGHDVIVSGTVEAALEMHCVRCLEPVEVAVASEFTLSLEPAPTDPNRKGLRSEIDLTADELDVDLYEHDRVDLGHWLREQIIVEAPSFPSCTAGCATPLVVPAQPADPEPLDPRLAPLKKLLNKE